ncbi:DUF7312 domain-containing protein [Haloparvum sp. PAK95]|uniref:DUF7312 domain-containing protein n=1 Tax=Haloparvum sp. PAK95 TaxID=3418962 RepID=UPI003D2EF46D
MSRANQPDPDAGDDEVAASADASESNEDEQWKFSLDEVGPDGIVEETSPGGGPIEPESVNPEHAVFVALGVAVAVGAVLTIFL